MSDDSNWQTCENGWAVNLSLGIAEHESGFKLSFNGHPSSRNFDVQPSGLEKGVSAVRWATLLRQGTDEYRRACAKGAGPVDEGERDEMYNAAPAAPRKPVITIKRKRQIG